MNRNKLKEIAEISKLLAIEENSTYIMNFMVEIFTESELETLSKRWQILQMLLQGKTQREIAKNLKVSLCKVTRGSQILKNRMSITAKYLKKEK